MTDRTPARATDLRESAEMHRQINRAIRERESDAAHSATRDHLMLAQRAREAGGA
jgi:GntR family transcriptional repressor for pyruvate dehydrogenase complex